MKIAVVGSGALGLYYGALLQRSGNDVHFLLRSDFDAITSHGLKVFSINGDFYLPYVKGYRTPEEIGTADLVLIGLKTFANDRLAELIGPLVGEETQILTLQNGLGNEEALSALYGADKILGGVAFLCSNRGMPGEVHHLGAGRVIVGEFTACNQGRLDRIVDTFVKAGIDCRSSEDLKRTRWEKLVWNIPFNGLCALLQQPVTYFLTHGPCRQLVHDIMIEVISAANAQRLSKPIPLSYADAMLEFTDGMGDYRPSMQIDREEGRQLEIDAILKVPISHGVSAGMSMPRVAMLTALLDSTQNGKCV